MVKHPLNAHIKPKCMTIFISITVQICKKKKKAGNNTQVLHIINISYHISLQPPYKILNLTNGTCS